MIKTFIRQTVKTREEPFQHLQPGETRIFILKKIDCVELLESYTSFNGEHFQSISILSRVD